MCVGLGAAGGLRNFREEEAAVGSMSDHGMRTAVSSTRGILTLRATLGPTMAFLLDKFVLQHKQHAPMWLGRVAGNLLLRSKFIQHRRARACTCPCTCRTHRLQQTPYYGRLRVPKHVSWLGLLSSGRVARGVQRNCSGEKCATWHSVLFPGSAPHRGVSATPAVRCTVRNHSAVLARVPAAVSTEAHGT